MLLFSIPFHLDAIIEAITSLKDLTGSSVPAITKFLTAKYGEIASHLLKAALKQGLKDGSIAVHHIHKSSYKLGAKKAAKKKAPAVSSRFSDFSKFGSF